MKGTPRRAAGIDIGTNSIKMAVGEVDASGRVIFLYEGSVNARLGAGTDASGTLSTESQQRAITVLHSFHEVVNDLDVGFVRAVGTSAMRDAANRDEFIVRVREETGIEVETASEDDEAKLAYDSVALDPEFGSFSGGQLVVDVGGGSTEIVHGIGHVVADAVSLRIGAVRLTERFLLNQNACRMVDAGTLAERMIGEEFTTEKIERVVGIGGSAVNLARMWSDIPIDRTEEVHGGSLNYRDIRKLMDVLHVSSADARKQMIGLEPERADIILGGAIILDRILAVARTENLLVSVRGLRHALVYELLNNDAH